MIGVELRVSKHKLLINIQKIQKKQRQRNSNSWQITYFAMEQRWQNGRRQTVH